MNRVAKVKCYNCNEFGHTSSECDQNCGFCDAEDHWSHNCPERLSGGERKVKKKQKLANKRLKKNKAKDEHEGDEEEEEEVSQDEEEDERPPARKKTKKGALRINAESKMILRAMRDEDELCNTSFAERLMRVERFLVNNNEAAVL